MNTEQTWVWNTQDYAKKQDRGKVSQYIHVDAKCICGRIRHIPVPAGDFESKRITEEPCECGKYTCIIQIGNNTMSMIDAILD